VAGVGPVSGPLRRRLQLAALVRTTGVNKPEHPIAAGMSEQRHAGQRLRGTDPDGLDASSRQGELSFLSAAYGRPGGSDESREKRRSLLVPRGRVPSAIKRSG
jgi:hypothetical protein